MTHAADEKCGTSDAICSECRMYSGGWSSKFELRDEDVASPQAFADWIEMIGTLGKIFLIQRPAFPLRQRDRLDCHVPAAVPAAAMEPAE